MSRRWPLPLASLLLGALLGSCRSRQDLPLRLSGTGLYRAGQTLAEGVLAFSPQYPLWSDGLDKSRWIQLPAGGRLDTRRPGSWEFPVGTRLWKEFRQDGRKVETRFFWKSAPEAWQMATYAWRPDQQEADLVPAGGADSGLVLAGGARHAFPSRQDCRTCHGTDRVEVLGFSALQLSPDRDPGALHGEALAPDMVTLRELEARGLVQGQGAPRIPGDPATRSLLGYLHGNCGGCHRADGPWGNLGLHLWHAPEHPGEVPGLATTLGKPGFWRQGGCRWPAWNRDAPGPAACWCVCGGGGMQARCRPWARSWWIGWRRNAWNPG